MIDDHLSISTPFLFGAIGRTGVPHRSIVSHDAPYGKLDTCLAGQIHQ